MKDSNKRFKPKKERLEFEWEETGKCEVEIFDNRSASIRFFPSEKVIDRTLKKLNTRSGAKDKK